MNGKAFGKIDDDDYEDYSLFSEPDYLIPTYLPVPADPAPYLALEFLLFNYYLQLSLVIIVLAISFYSSMIEQMVIMDFFLIVDVIIVDIPLIVIPDAVTGRLNYEGRLDPLFIFQFQPLFLSQSFVSYLFYELRDPQLFLR
ncbi:MAG: hypothetical protein EZS28_045157 [Streblomastix strix]|uniref:Uncharacterized protein n=1 Tax=Streblomastix strix TaxID=222440 RepID=A0A5J4TLD9_9EUKA|nr:MAG: hypothetical protein EZS28_045157 [Streblomastix strix]